MKLSDESLEKIEGGEVGIWVYLIVTSVIIFASGIINGYTHVKPCNN